MANELSKAGFENPKDVINFIVNNIGSAQQLYPKYYPIDALYKAMHDGTVRASV